MRKLRIDEWLVRAVQAMYRDAVSKAITEEFKRGCPWDLLYADDLALIVESLSELEKFQCKLWTHKKCSNIKGRLTSKIVFVCGKCSGAINTENVQRTTSITFQGKKTISS
uniref:Reverse transcriptase domain-containing protein n=1 Tax=Octopus bimaculoides TaxID=37653 RepID=A0A0L8G7S3_OCTBM